MYNTSYYVDYNLHETQRIMFPALYKEFNDFLVVIYPGVFETHTKKADPFLKVTWQEKEFNKEGFRPIRYIARISMIEPKYITGFNENRIMNQEELEWFKQTIPEKWEEITDTYNREYGGCMYFPWYTELKVMPDYNKLSKENK